MSGQSWVADVEELHAKFGDLPGAVAALSPDHREEFWQWRLRFLAEEMEELRSAAHPADAVDALVDLCVVAIGTLHAFGVDARLAWWAVQRANAAKEPGTNARRPNPFGFPDMLKPEGWVPPDHSGNVGLVPIIAGEVPS